MYPPITAKTLDNQSRSSGNVAFICSDVAPIYRISSGSSGGRKNIKYSPIPTRARPPTVNAHEDACRRGAARPGTVLWLRVHASIKCPQCAVAEAAQAVAALKNLAEPPSLYFPLSPQHIILMLAFSIAPNSADRWSFAKV
jgi:hypothetical protein